MQEVISIINNSNNNRLVEIPNKISTKEQFSDFVTKANNDGITAYAVQRNNKFIKLNNDNDTNKGTKDYINANQNGHMGDVDAAGHMKIDNSSSPIGSSSKTATDVKNVKANTKNAVSILENNEELVLFQVNNKIGYKNKAGKIIIPAIYNDGSKFNDGIAFVKKADKWAIIDNNAKLLTKFEFNDVKSIYNSPKWIAISNKQNASNKLSKVIQEIYPGMLGINYRNNTDLSKYALLNELMPSSDNDELDIYSKMGINKNDVMMSKLSSVIFKSLTKDNKVVDKKNFQQYDEVWKISKELYCGFKKTSEDYCILDESGKIIFKISNKKTK